jgi:hypothetical protein
VSLHGVEKALYDLGVDRASKTAFREDPDAFLGRYRLAADEHAMVAAFDVAALIALGVNPMLTMGYWIEVAPDRSMRSYLARVRAPSEKGPA